MTDTPDEATTEDITEDITEAPTEVTTETRPDGHVAHDLPDLGAVQARIDEAHEAEDHLVAVMPSGIQPDDDAYDGMSGPTEGDVEETDAAQTTDDEREARSPEQPAAEQVQEDVTGTADDAKQAERS